MYIERKVDRYLTGCQLQLLDDTWASRSLETMGKTILHYLEGKKFCVLAP